MQEIIDRQINPMLLMISDFPIIGTVENSQPSESAVLKSSNAGNQIVPRTCEILFVDDTKCVRVSFQLILRKLGQHIRNALNGEFTLNAILDKTPAIVFPDISMNGMEGYQLVRSIRSIPQNSHIRLIALTAPIGTNTHENTRMSIDAAFDHIFEKPKHHATLINILNAM